MTNVFCHSDKMVDFLLFCHMTTGDICRDPIEKNEYSGKIPLGTAEEQR